MMKLVGQVRRRPRKVTRWSGTRNTPQPAKRNRGYSARRISNIYDRVRMRSVMMRGLYW